MKKNQGFTLIELMVVIAIIGILAAIALPAYQDYTARAQVSEAVSMMGGLKAAVTETYSNSAECPINLTEAKFGMASAPKIVGRYVASIQGATGSGGATCELIATFKSKDVAQPLQGKKIKLSMTTKDGSDMWECSSDGIAAVYLPSSCRK
ncbi:MAG: pilin [Kingella sp. (in: b-proteobacteria)]